MPLNWDSVSAKDVERACEQLAAAVKDKRKGLVIVFRDRVLPAKEVLRVAYRNANGLASTVDLKFSSGEGTLAILQKLGFTAERRVASDTAPDNPASR